MLVTSDTVDVEASSRTLQLYQRWFDLILRIRGLCWLRSMLRTFALAKMSGGSAQLKLFAPHQQGHTTRCS